MTLFMENRRSGHCFHIALTIVFAAAAIWAAIGIRNAVASTPLYDPPDIDGIADTVHSETAPIYERINAAAEVLRFGFEPAIPETLSLLVELSDHPETDIRMRATGALGAMRLPSAEGFGLLTEALRDPSPAVREVAVFALMRISGIAPPDMRQSVIEPAIFAALAEGRTEFRTKLLDTIYHTKLSSPAVGRGIVEALRAEDAVLRKHAAWVLPLVDPRGIDAVAELIRLTKDSQWEVRQEAVESLGQLRRNPETTVPLLAKFLKDSSPDVREAAAKALGAFGIAAAPEIPALQHALTDAVDYVRNEAAVTLAWIEEVSGYTEPALLSLLESPDAKERREAVRLFTWLMKDAEKRERRSREETASVRPGAARLSDSALEAFVKAANDPDEDVAAAAVLMLGNYAPRLDDIAALVIEKLVDDRAGVRKSARALIPRLSRESPAAATVFTGLLRSDNAALRANAHDAFRNMGLDLTEAVPVLVAIVEEESGAVRVAAIKELRRVAQRSELAQMALENVDDELGQPATAQPPPPGKRLDTLNQPDEALQTILETQLRQPRPDEFRHSAPIMGLIAQNGRVGAFEDVLLLHLRDPDWGVRATSVETLRSLTWEQGAFAVPVLVELVRLDEHANVREASVHVLGKLGPGRPGVVEALTAALSDDDASVRLSTEFALAALGPEAASAVPAMIGSLEEKLLSTCGNFGGRLSKIDRTAAEALLIERMQDDTRKVRRNAICAFASLSSLDVAFRARRTKILVAALEGAFGRGIEQVIAAGSLYSTDLRLDDVKLAVLSAMDGDDHRIRNKLLSLFGRAETHEDSIISAIKDALNDPHPDIRSAAASTLARIRPFTAAPEIRAALEREQDKKARESFSYTVAKLEKY